MVAMQPAVDGDFERLCRWSAKTVMTECWSVFKFQELKLEQNFKYYHSDRNSLCFLIF